MITFSIKPYVGPLPVLFGMAPIEVEELLGPYVSAFQNHTGNYVEQREALSFAYSNSQLVEAVFSPGAALFFEEVDLFSHPDPIRFLRGFDDSPFEWVGFIVFLKLGIRLSGFHDNDMSQKAIGVVRKGYWDEYADDFVPYP